MVRISPKTTLEGFSICTKFVPLCPVYSGKSPEKQNGAWRTMLHFQRNTLILLTFGGEGGIRTHVPGLTDNPISSRARYGRFATSPLCSALEWACRIPSYGRYARKSLFRRFFVCRQVISAFERRGAHLFLSLLRLVPVFSEKRQGGFRRPSCPNRGGTCRHPLPLRCKKVTGRTPRLCEQRGIRPSFSGTRGALPPHRS